jgi:D-tyrosyl-tRNA(Tyr) deacylase
VRAVLQRVNRAGVTVDADRVAEIGPGLMILLGVGQGDTEETCRALASKTARLRIFEDEQGKMNRSLLDTGGSALVVSQFTLYGDTRKGLRPSFTSACEPKRAEELYLRFASELGYLGVPVKTGRFAARMDVDLVNSGPVTILLDTEEE